MSQIQELKAELQTIAMMGASLGLLGWDEEVYMPPQAHQFRGEVKALLSSQLHQRFTAPAFVKLSQELVQPASLSKLDPDDQVIARETWHDVSRAKKLPVDFVEKLARLTSESFSAWATARQKSDFKIFEPALQKMLDMKRQEAKFIGYKDSPYDALLDGFETGMNVKMLDQLFMPLAMELSKLIKSAGRQKPAQIPKAKYKIEDQKELNNFVAAALGYDMQTGRLDISAHPFTTGFHPTDVRITTRYDEDNFWIALGGTIHEAGHGMYEQGLQAKYYGTPLGEAASLGVHESQSRIWENFVGRSREFSEYLHPQLKKYLTSQVINFSPEELYAWLNRVEPSLIRVEADEVTYNLHIVLRYELEKALVEGSLAVKDLPAAWNKKMKDYLGIDVPNDAEGVLQDVHWSHGYFGYFPTYSLGNLYSAQLFHAAQKAAPNLTDGFAKGDFSKFLAWLRKEIHVHGRRYQPEELITRATGEPPNPQYLIDHLAAKVQAL